MLVYRYEKGGLGPYRRETEHYPELEEMADFHLYSGKHPVIGNDTKGISTMEHLCACSTVEQLKSWFKGYNTHLRSYGYKIYEYDVTKINDTYSGRQCEFHKDHIISKRIYK